MAGTVRGAADARVYLVSYEHFRTMRILLREALELLPPGVVEAGPPSGEMHKALLAWHTYITHYIEKYYPGVLTAYNAGELGDV